MWIGLALLSSVFLAMYDVLRKASLKGNAVIPVLFLGSGSSAILFIVLLFFSRTGLLAESHILFVPKIDLHQHFLFFIKAVLVGSSWFLAYFAIKNLPLTIVMPIRATGPFWTLLGAMVIYDERFSTYQWIGIIVVLSFFYLSSLAGKREGINFQKNKWIFAIIGGTMLGAISGMYDKYLLMNYHRMAVQTWFSIYTIPVFLPFLMFIWFPKRKTLTPFTWKWTIPLIGIAIALADFMYFFALSYPDSLIGIVSVVRRSSVILSFVMGALLFKEINLKHKAFALFGILVGIILIIIGS